MFKRSWSFYFGMYSKKWVCKKVVSAAFFLLLKVKINTHFYFSKVKKRNFTERKTEIKDIQDSFVVTDNTEIGHGNKIPLWLFGLLY